MWRKDDLESLLKLMREAVTDRAAMVARMPRFAADDNTRKLADDVEMACGARTSLNSAASPSDAIAGS